MKSTTAARILIVDDMPLNLQALSKILKDDYKILVATSGEKALAIAQKDPVPDLILLDVMMPEMDGSEVCRRLKANESTQNIPVIFVTAQDKPEDEEKGFSLGAVDYISKPFSPIVVKARVRTHVLLKMRTDALENATKTDGLTGIPNRRSLEEYLERSWRQAQRTEVSFSVLMIDIDHFKRYNDNYGHGAGDDCLRSVARALYRVVRRPMDFVARYGGEEFAVLLPETDSAGALNIAEAMLDAVRELVLPHEYSDTANHVTISIGCATQVVQRGADPEPLMQAADQALYHAKESGRNQVAQSAETV